MFWINWFKSKAKYPMCPAFAGSCFDPPSSKWREDPYKSCSKGTQRMAAPCRPVALLFKLTTQAMATATYMVNSNMMVADGPADISAFKESFMCFSWLRFLLAKNTGCQKLVCCISTIYIYIYISSHLKLSCYGPLQQKISDFHIQACCKFWDSQASKSFP